MLKKINIKILEDLPEIDEKYLLYISNIFNLIKFREDFEKINIDAVLIRSGIDVTSDFLQNYPNLKYIFRIGVGLDKIDKKECEQMGIKIFNTPGSNSDSVSDLVIAAILNLSRKLHYPYLGIKNRFDYMGSEIGGKIVGIIGFGNIGKKIYERLLGFGVKEFLVYDPFIKKGDIESFKYCKKIENKNDIFITSDIISFHIPLLESTKKFLGKNEIELLKNNVIIINTSRGGIIDETNLISFLQKNSNSSFFADVWEEEPNEPKKGLFDLKNCIITPHIGAMTQNAIEKMHYFKELEEGNL